MDKTKYIYGGLAVVIIVLLGIIAFNNKSEKPPVEPQVNNQANAAPVHEVTVEDFINTSNYTYVKVKENDQEFWIAINKMDVKKGEKLYYSKSMEMKNFHSTELNKDFDLVYFVDGVSTTPQAANQKFVHPQVKQEAKENVKVEAYPGGKTIQEIIEGKAALNGKVVKVKGKVTKVNDGIMGRNWIHIQDGTSSNGEYDLLVTSTESAHVGDVVAFEGTVATNKDFGAGYSYDVLLENAKVLKVSKPL